MVDDTDGEDSEVSAETRRQRYRERRYRLYRDQTQLEELLRRQRAGDASLADAIADLQRAVADRLVQVGALKLLVDADEAALRSSDRGSRAD